MGLANIKLSSKAERGFTIVELLIVVVVIAILAAITIVSYNGITGRANASAAKSLAATWAKKVELYQAEEGAYPVDAAALRANSAKSWHINDGSLDTVANLSSSTGSKKVSIQSCKDSAGAPDATNVERVVITYWDFEKSPQATSTRIVGTGTATTNCATVWSNT